MNLDETTLDKDGSNNEPEVEVTLDETIGAALDAIMAEEPAASPSTPAPAEGAEAVEGKEKPKADEPASTPTQNQEPAAEPPSDTPPVRSAPNTWKKEAAAEFAKLPPVVQAEIERREADFHKGIEQYKTKATFGHEIEQTIAPYMATINSLQTTPSRAIQVLLNADHKLRYGDAETKLQGILTIARDYGIPLDRLQDFAANPPPAPDPQVLALNQRIGQLEGSLQQRQQAEEQQQVTRLQTMIEDFASAPNHEHFPVVRQAMSALIRDGIATDLQDAYDKAIWADPTIRPLLLAKQQEAARQEADRKAKEARRAGFNVQNRHSVPPPAPKIPTNQTLDETIGGALDEILGRVG